MKIVDIKNDLVTVEFQDKYKYRMTTIFMNFKTGGIKNPYDKTIVGVGYIGDGKYKSWENGKSTLVYAIWKAMITRCYYEKDKDLHPTYYGRCTVCEEWHNYQTFAKWYEEHKYEVKGRLHLDKDILYPGCNLYSPKTCLLVPQRINELFTISTRKNDGLPQGIRRTKTNRYSVQYCGKNLGLCKTYEEACTKYKEEKERVLKEVAEEYKSKIPMKLYSALVNYDVKVA